MDPTTRKSPHPAARKPPWATQDGALLSGVRRRRKDLSHSFIQHAAFGSAEVLGIGMDGTGELLLLQAVVSICR